MKTDWAILANAAEVRDGMINIISGGWNIASRPSYPAVFYGAIAVRLLFEPHEARSSHTMHVSVFDRQGAQLAQIPLAVPAAPLPDVQYPVGVEVPLTVAANLTGVVIPAAGLYFVAVSVDNLEQQRIAILFAPASPEPPAPGVQAPRAEGQPE